jgi:hypothetical protein
MPRPTKIALGLLILAALTLSGWALTDSTAFGADYPVGTPPTTATTDTGPPPVRYGSHPGTGTDLTGPLLTIGAGATAIGAALLTAQRRRARIV